MAAKKNMMEKINVTSYECHRFLGKFIKNLKTRKKSVTPSKPSN